MSILSQGSEQLLCHNPGCSEIHAMAIVQGRLHLMGEGHGLVFDIPYEEVEQVYGAAEGTSLHVA